MSDDSKQYCSFTFISLLSDLWNTINLERLILYGSISLAGWLVCSVVVVSTAAAAVASEPCFRAAELELDAEFAAALLLFVLPKITIESYLLEIAPTKITLLSLWPLVIIISWNQLNHQKNYEKARSEFHCPRLLYSKWIKTFEVLKSQMYDILLTLPFNMIATQSHI